MKRSGFKRFIYILEIIIVLIMLVVIGLLVWYVNNPIGMKEDLNNLIGEMAEYILQNNSVETAKDDIVLPEAESLTGEQKYYYYQQLNDVGKKIYVSIENNLDKIMNGEDNIPLPQSLNADAKSSDNGKQLIATEFQTAWDAFIADRSENFYLDSSKVCLVTKIITKGKSTNYEFFIGKGQNKNYFMDEFSSKEDVEKAVAQVEKVKNEIIKNASGNNYNKIKYIHNWIIDNVEYDTKESNNTSNIYGCLVQKKVVCEGYARTFKYLMDELDIPCVLVSGTATDETGKSERHAWNYVYIKNAWYAIDVTWDDPIIIGNGKANDSIRYKYFLRGSDFINKDHIEAGQITKDGYKFSYPKLSAEDIS